MSEALILAGGLGTRLRALVADRPKVLAEVNGRPFLSYLLDQLLRTRVRRAILCTGHLADLVEITFGSAYRGLELVYSREEQPLGTGGALRQACAHVSSSPIFALNGDSYIDLDPSRLVALHSHRRADATLALTQVLDVSRFGAVLTASDQRVLAFREKATAVGPGWINAGFYCLDPALLLELPAGRAVSMEREVFPTWLQRRFYAQRTEGRFIDIGTPESLAAASAVLAAPLRE